MKFLLFDRTQEFYTTWSQSLVYCPEILLIAKKFREIDTGHI